MSIEAILTELDSILSMGIDTYSRADQQRVIQLRDLFIPYKAKAKRAERQARTNRDKYRAEQVLMLKNQKKEDGKSKYTQGEYEGLITIDTKYIELVEALGLAEYENALYGDKLNTFTDSITLIRDGLKDSDTQSR